MNLATANSANIEKISCMSYTVTANQETSAGSRNVVRMEANTPVFKVFEGVYVGGSRGGIIFPPKWQDLNPASVGRK